MRLLAAFVFACQLVAGAVRVAAQDEEPMPVRTTSGPYVVLAVDLNDKDDDSRAWRKVGLAASEDYDGKLIDFDGEDWELLKTVMGKQKPENLLVVIRPDLLDVNFHRRLLLLLRDIDEDPFVDCALGYLTGRDAKQAKALYERSSAVRKNGFATKTWHSLGVATGIKSTIYEGKIGEAPKGAGFTGSSFYLGCRESDPDVLAFYDKATEELSKAAVLEITGNGDPEGIWCFDGKRNLDRSKHWAFDEAKVGQDPKGEMPRIDADRIRKLKLQNAIVWSGTCHCAVPRLVFIEDDIVSTFGRVEKTALFELKPEKSYCIAMLDAGAAAFIAPIAANHGMSVDKEIEFAIVNGASLGEAVKSTYDDVFLQHGAKLALDFVRGGDAKKRTEPIMAGGGVNRILIGDPALRPFAKTEHPLEKIVVEKGADVSKVSIAWKKGFHPWAWDMFGTDKSKDGRIYAKIEYMSAGAVQATVVGKGTALSLKHAALEWYHGRTYLHLQASGDRKTLSDKDVSADFTIKRK